MWVRTAESHTRMESVQTKLQTVRIDQRSICVTNESVVIVSYRILATVNMGYAKYLIHICSVITHAQPKRTLDTLHSTDGNLLMFNHCASGAWLICPHMTDLYSSESRTTQNRPRVHLMSEWEHKQKRCRRKKRKKESQVSGVTKVHNMLLSLSRCTFLLFFAGKKPQKTLMSVV